MKLLLDSLWRAAAYCFLPRVIGLSLLPLLLLAILGSSLGYFFWSNAVESIRLWLEGSGFISTILDWFTRFGLQSFRAAVAPIILIALATPVLIVLVMWVVVLLMTPALIQLVSQRRFATLVVTKGSTLGFLSSAAWSISSTLLAVALLVISMPLWFIPPLIMILPPLIWGWLTYRVMSFDALSTHANSDERRAVMQLHKRNLMAIGLITGFLGAVPSLIWALGTMVAVFAVLLLPVMLWLYTLVFAFSSLWFIHYCLAALEQYRKV